MVLINRNEGKMTMDTILYSGHSEQTTAGREKRRYRY